MNREPITLRNLLMKARIQDQKVLKHFNISEQLLLQITQDFQLFTITLTAVKSLNQLI
jgi:uncharacterized membrane-anchored protein YhcB (DUF1043 family)